MARAKPPPATPPVAHLYVRVSTVEQAKGGSGIDAQRFGLEAYFAASLAGYQNPGLYVEDGVSGKVPFRRRPVGKILWERLRRGDALVVTKLDRGFRNAADAFRSFEDMDRLGCRLVLVESAIDSSTPIGKAMLGMLAVFAEFERQRIGERTREALAARKLKGLAPPGRVPPGFKNVGQKGQRRREADPVTAAVQNQIRRWFAEGHSYETIHKHLMSNGVCDWSLWKIRRAVETEREERHGHRTVPAPVGDAGV